MTAERLSLPIEFECPDTIPDDSGRRIASSASMAKRTTRLGFVPAAPPVAPSSARPAGPWRRGFRIDRYELVEEIAVGGMGVIWSARDLDLGRDVAMKLIPSGGFPLEAQRVRLLAEARAMARLSHTNVVTVYDVGATDVGLFIAMEQMDGGNLREWLEAEPRSWRAVLAKFIAAGRGLAEAHRAGLVHRDFKPDNVLVGADGVARVSDFGLALLLGAPREVEQGIVGLREVTQSGGIAGTLAYMAPEQLLGDKVTARSDQFSFCVALYEALYAARPFGAGTDEAPAAVLLAGGSGIRLGSPPPGCRVPGALHDLIGRGLARDPNGRWPALDALVAELESCLDTGRGRARRPSEPTADGAEQTSETKILHRLPTRTSSWWGDDGPWAPAVEGEVPTPSMVGPAPPAEDAIRFEEVAGSVPGFAARRFEIFLGGGVALVASATAFLITHRTQTRTLEAVPPATPPGLFEKQEPARSDQSAAPTSAVAAPAPPSARTVMVHIVSSPAGGVQLEGGEAVCETPCTLTITFNPGDIGSYGQRAYIVRRRGYEDQAISIDLASPPREVRVELERSSRSRGMQ